MAADKGPDDQSPSAWDSILGLGLGRVERVTGIDRY